MGIDTEGNGRLKDKHLEFSVDFSGQLFSEKEDVSINLIINN